MPSILDFFSSKRPTRFTWLGFALATLLVVAAGQPPLPSLAQGSCDVEITPYFTEYFGDVSLNGLPAPIGTVVEAFNSGSVRTGCSVVNIPGIYGYMRVYGADPDTGIPGMATNEPVTFKVDGVVANTVPAEVLWAGDKDQHEVELSATSVATPSISLLADWNLISIPVQPADPSPGAVLDSIAGDYDVAYAYTPNPGWKRYEPGAPGFVNTLTAITPSQGVWIHATRATVLEVAGAIPPSTTIPLVAGWNLIGYPASESRTVETVLDSIIAHVVAVYAYDAGDLADPWKRYIPGAGDNDLAEFEPGRGYWLKVEQECELVIEYY